MIFLEKNIIRSWELNQTGFWIYLKEFKKQTRLEASGGKKVSALVTVDALIVYLRG